MANTNQNIAWDATYDPFGKANITVSYVTNNLRFPGQYYDAETGLHYNWHRYYWPEVGRYVSPELIIAPRTPIIYPTMQLPDFLGEQKFFIDESTVSSSYFNPYIYVRNNPVFLKDLWALFSYNQPPPGTLPVPPDTGKKINCLESCLGLPLVVTDGAECKGHTTGSAHCKGEAADFSFKRNPQLSGMKKKFMCCANKCKFGYAKEESNPPHYHVQTGPGKGGSRGDLPVCPGECQ